jgi:phosphatidylglycerophosphatase A
LKRLPFLKTGILIVATAFGLGLAPVASGTFGALPGLLIVWLLTSCWKLPLFWFIIIAAVLAAVSIPICDVAEKHFKQKDDRRIVADEMLTFPICMIALPPEPLMLAIAFAISRAFDIIKPPPARASQSLKGGLGITIDDVIANIYALFLNHIVFWILKSKGLI